MSGCDVPNWVFFVAGVGIYQCLRWVATIVAYVVRSTGILKV